ncbi:MAG: proline dehydrogenase [bacterium]|nr:proline dehydrogenase [bacterium]
MVTFDNTEIAFQSRSDSELNKAYFLLKVLQFPRLVKLGHLMTNAAIKLHFPISWIVKPTVYRLYCGGETIEESTPTIRHLERLGVKTVLAYSVEGEGESADFDAIVEETVLNINYAKKDPSVPFAVFKPTGFTSLEILEKVSEGGPLSPDEQKEADAFEKRMDTLCRSAYDAGVPIQIDAEETFCQKAIDDVADRMMETYNKEKLIVYNTFQLYRTDRLEFLKESYHRAMEKNYKFGAKLVRGAYMEMERERAGKMGYPSPIHPDKESTDKDFDLAQEFCITHIEGMSVYSGTHNQESSLHLARLMEQHNIAKNDPRVYFAQLYGMSDQITFNLAHAGYNVAKYVPYGPVRDVLPYLMRRAEENTSVKGQMGRELKLVIEEKKRRRNIGKARSEMTGSTLDI